MIESHWDTRVNKYDNLTYWGDLNWLNVEHSGGVEIGEPNTCAYCQESFYTKKQLFNHLGFCGVDIRKKSYINNIEQSNRPDTPIPSLDSQFSLSSDLLVLPNNNNNIIKMGDQEIVSLHVPSSHATHFCSPELFRSIQKTVNINI